MIVIRKDSTIKNRLYKNLTKYYSKTKRTDDVIHVSDILPTPICIRRSYYGRRFPDLNVITEDSAKHFLRGQSSEYGITKLLDAGTAQLDVKFGSVKAHPDIAGKDRIFELKDTTSLSRLTYKDDAFKGYLRQLLWYMVMTKREKGIIMITYNAPELIPYQKINEGELLLKKYGAKPETHTWDIYLGLDDPIRDMIIKEIEEREELFKNALKNNDVSILPRLPEKFERSKCNYCPYKTKCFREDNETEKAYKYGHKKDWIEDYIDFSTDIAPNIA